MKRIDLSAYGIPEDVAHCVEVDDVGTRAVLDAADVPAMRLNTLQSLLHDAHLEATGFFRRQQHPSEGELRLVGPAANWSRTQPSIERPAPRLGEHGAEILREAGLDQEEIASLTSGNDKVE